jgi:hypothetical protein
MPNGPRMEMLTPVMTHEVRCEPICEYASCCTVRSVGSRILEASHDTVKDGSLQTPPDEKRHTQSGIAEVPWRICQWHFGAPLLGTSWLRLVGVFLIAAGLPVLLDSFGRFALQGLGTPAPIFPTRRLVVSGLFRYVRNPMYIAVVCLILGQGLLFGNLRVLEYGLAVWIGFYLFVLIYEEPVLRKVMATSTKNSAQMFRRGFRACDPGGKRGREIVRTTNE